LVRSFKEVDADRTAVTGISWGGYLTCIVASLDDRFKAAVPVYGCGFLYEGESVQKPSIDRLSPEHRAEWIRLYEPSTWLPQCRVPILFVNGTNDVHYPLDSYARTYALVPANRHVRIQVQMPHSHPAGWAPAEIGLFIDQHLKGSDPLPVFAVPAMQQQTVSAGFSSSRPLQKAELHYTTDSGRLADRSWHTVPATIVDQTITATVPQDALIWLLSATDDRGAMTSTEVLFRD
jgi:PhoPQ-activated pathogenicity-related protein